MENAIPSLLIGAVLLVASALLSHSTIQSYGQIGDSMRQMQTRINDQVKTRLTIHDAAMPDASSLDFQLDNNGGTIIAAYNRLDVIVSYATSDGSQRTVWLPYSDEDAPPADSWSLSSIDRDVFDPGILN